jgi:ATP-dependent exoDNAse (exonuclease V) beta subunit
MVKMTELSIVPAGAGAGKTHHIQETLTQWVREEKVRPERILAVTFTEAAAGELRQRIRSALISDGNLQAALAVERAYVSTIHGLGRRLLIEHAFASGSSPQQRLIAEDEQDLLIRRSIEENEALRELSRNLAAFGYRGSFVSDETAEDSFRKRLLGVIGLLRTLGPRGSDPAMADFAEASIRQGYGEPQGSTDALAAGLKAAVDDLLRAFPRSLAETATNATAKSDFRENFQALKQSAQMLAGEGKDWRLWQKLRGFRQSKRGSPTPDGYDDLADAVMAEADKLVSHPGPLEDAILHARALVEGAQAAMSDYETRKRELGVIDFSDMVTNAARILDEKPEVLAAIMDEVDCVIVDEFQDTNPIQFTFLWALARKAKHALIVGDTKQAIMGFQGADPRLTVALTNQFETSPLDRNWRSDARIMDFVNALGPCLFGEDYTPLTAQNPAGPDTALEVIQLACKRNSRSSGKPQHFIADRLLSLLADEKIAIIDRHSNKLRELEPRDIAVLCPTHSHCASYAGALRSLGLPVRVAEGGWWQSHVVQAACFALRVAVDPNDRHAAICMATLGPGATPLPEALGALAQHGRIAAPEIAGLEALWPESLATPVDHLVHQVIRASGLREWCDLLDDPAQMRADLLRFEAEAGAFMEAHRDMREASGFYGQSANVFLGWLENKVGLKGEDLRPNPAGAEADGIEIVTWHASKGREWPIVVVCGLDHKFDPRPATFSTKFPGFDDLDHVIGEATLAYAPEFAAPEATDRFLEELYPECEETARRLLYVALTRARNRLIIEWPQDDEKVEPPLPITARRLMNDVCGLTLQGNQITISAERFPARMTICDKEIPASFAAETRVGLGALDRELRFAIEQRPVMELEAVISPSLALSTHRPLPREIETRAIADGVRLSGTDLAQATDKGTAVHEALRILLCRPDLKDRVSQHCRASEAEVELLAKQAQALGQTLMDLGYPRLHVEQPIEIELADGGRQSIIVDLIAEGTDGFMIVDHKSGPVVDHALRFESYWPQLAAYIEAVGAKGSKAVRSVGIFWTETGELTVCGDI